MNQSAETNQILEFGRFRLDMTDRVLSVESRVVPLTPKVCDLLVLLVQNPGRVLRKEWLVSSLWPETYVEEANLSVNISTLRRALESSGGEHFIETIPKRGYRFTGQVRGLNDSREGIFQQDKAPPPSPAVVAAKRRKWPAAVLAVLCLGALVVLIERPLFHRIRSLSEVQSLAVLPFRPLAGAASNVSANSEDAVLGIGMADAIIRELSSIQRIRVRPTSSVQKFYSATAEPTAAGRELHVDVVMDGHIQRMGQMVRVSVQLLRVNDGAPIWADRFDDYYTNIFQLQDSISEKVASALKMKLSESDHVKMTRRRTKNIEAYEAYLEGDYCEMRQAPESPPSSCFADYQAAVNKDPNYALGYAGMARTCIDLVDIDTLSQLRPKCREMAQKAISLDADLPETHLALGNVLFRADWNWLEAQREFDRGLALDEYSPMAHWYLAWLLMAMDHRELALSEMKKAHLLDPASTNIRVGLAWAYDCNQRTGDAIGESRKAIEMNAGLVASHEELGRAYLHAGSYREAVKEFETAARIDVTHVAAVRLDVLKALAEYRSTGKPTPLGELAARLKQLQPDATAHEPIYEIAILEANLGRFDEAFRVLERAVSLKLRPAIWMAVDPELAPLKRDARFGELLRRVKLVS